MFRRILSAFEIMTTGSCKTCFKYIARITGQPKTVKLEPMILHRLDYSSVSSINRFN
jgi:hypothetical protein